MSGLGKRLGGVVARHPEVGWFSLLALVIMGPMLRPGFVLTLDMVFTPKLVAPTAVSNSYLFHWLLHVVNLVLPGQVVEKLLIFAILLTGGIGMYRLMQTKAELPRYFAGLFYTVNPFTYERWMAGQYLLLAGYALLPFLVAALASFCVRPGRRTAARVAGWYCAIALVSVHMLVIGSLLGAIIFVVHLFAQSPKGNYYRNMWRYGGLAVVGVVVLNSYWLAGVAGGSSPISQTIRGIGSRDLSAFSTAGHHGLFVNVVSLYGFWLERYGRYAMPNHNPLVWLVGGLLILLLVVIGGRERWRTRSLLAVSLALAGLIGLVVALGVQAPVSGPVVRWGIEHLPLMRGFREPEKFSALLALAYVYFAAHGLDRLLARVKPAATGRLELLRDGALLLPVFYTATMPFGFVNQLKAVQYPASWYSFNRQLQATPPSGKLLFLPWHEYMSYDFTPRIIANPAPAFFDGSVIAGTNAQFGGIDDPTPTPTSRFVESQVLGRSDRTDLGHTLARIHVQYVLLAHGYDYSQYGFLSRQRDLKLVSHASGLDVYRNEAYRG